jgi:serine/threonine protein kinase
MSFKEFPSNADYTTIVKNLTAFISEKYINSGKPKYSKRNRLISYAGGYSKVFPVQLFNKTVALRFWTANIEDSQKRYQEIEKYLKEKKLSYFVDFKYHNSNLVWKNAKYPFISMDWIEGETLNRYLDKNIRDSYKILKIADSFLEMVKVLHQHNIAHGDLQDGNILIVETEGTIELKLIDYDTIFVPSLKNFNIEIMGVESYQHPKKNNTKKLSKKIDYFSELVIYLSLLVYSEDSSLWKTGQEQRLVFKEKDFKNPTKSKIFIKLKGGNYSSQIQELTHKLEEYCLKSNIDELLPLEECLIDKFKEVTEIFRKIKSIKSKPIVDIIDNDKMDKSIDEMKKKFSVTKSKKKIDTKKIDDKFANAIKNAMKKKRG